MKEMMVKMCSDDVVPSSQFEMELWIGRCALTLSVGIWHKV